MPDITKPADVIADARRWLGTMYTWGGDDESEGGVDCSGLIIDAFRDAGGANGFTTAFPAGTRPIASQIGRAGTAAQFNQATPGDVLYWDNPGPTDHVALFLGNGEYIEAPDVGKPVRISRISFDNLPTSVRKFMGGASGDAPGQTPPKTDNVNGYEQLGEALGGAVGGIGTTFARYSLIAVAGVGAVGLVVLGAYKTVSSPDK